jgi:hypothetical protein
MTRTYAILDPATGYLVSAEVYPTWHGAWSDATAYVPGDMVSLDGASWVCVLANTALRPFPPDYREAMLVTAPVSYWRLGESDPSTMPAVDEMDVALNGTYVNSPTSVAGLLTGDGDTAVTFAAASSQRVDIGASTSLDATTAVTISAWIKRAAPPAGNEWFFSRRSGIKGYELMTWSSGQVLMFCGDGAAYAIPTGGPNVCDGVGHFVVVVRDGSAFYSYVDGVIAYADAVIFASVGSMSGLTAATIASFASGGGDLSGTLDEPAIWDRALTPAEDAGLYAVGTGTVVWERVSAKPAAYATGGTTADIIAALIAAGLMVSR